MDGLGFIQALKCSKMEPVDHLRDATGKPCRVKRWESSIRVQLQIGPTLNFLIAPASISLAITRHSNFSPSSNTGFSCDSAEMTV